MSNQGKFSSITIILLIIGLVVGAGGGYLASSNSLQPEIIDLKNQVSSLNSEIATLIAALDSLEEEKSDLETQVVELNTQKSSLEELLEQALLQLNECTVHIKIGMLAREEKSFFSMRSIALIAEDEINRYCEENGFPYRFEFLLESTQGQESIALEKVQSFRAMGIELVVAYLGSEYNFLLSYINDYSMAFIDAVNTMPEFAFPGEGLYRMHPTWVMQGYALAENIWSLGKEAVIVIRQDSPYMDEIYDVFTTRYVAKGGDIFAEIVLPDPEVVEYSNFFDWLDEKINDAHTQYGECNVGIQLFAYTDFLSLFPYLPDYPTTLNVIWFGNEALANQPTLFMYHPTTADRIKILSPSPFIDVDSDMYHTFASAYSSLYGGDPSYEDCLVYDSCWVMAKSMIAAGSPEGDQVNPFVITTSNNHQGVTGWCKLDANGDRALMEYDIWGYSIESDGFTALRYGYYTGETDMTTWLTARAHVCVPDVEWIKLFEADLGPDFEDDSGQSVIQTLDGGYVIAGYTFLGPQDGPRPYINMWLIKTDSSGIEEWNYTFSSGSSYDRAYSVIQTVDGGYLIAGDTFTFGFGNAVLIKTFSNGIVDWSQDYGSNVQGYVESANDVIQTDDLGYLFVGTNIDYLGGLGPRIWLVKTNNLGIMAWEKILTNGVGSSVQQTLDNGYIISGYNDTGMLLIKTDNSGNIVWEKLYGEPFDEGMDAIQTSDGGYVLAGSRLIKTDSDGNMIWESESEGPSVKETSDGGYILSSLIKVDPYGVLEWEISEYNGFDIELTIDGGCIITGEYEADALLVKIANFQ